MAEAVEHVARIQDDLIEVPTLTFTKGERRIRIIGVVHVAPPDHWDALSIELAQMASQGWVVHLEGVRSEVENPGPLLRAIKKLATGSREMALIAFPGLVYQSALRWPDSARVVDLRAEEIVARLSLVGKASAFSFATFISGVLRFPDDILREGLGDGFEETFTDPSRQTPIFMRGLAPALVDARNEHAVRHALAEDAGRVVMVWGLGHLPGMADLLVADGWVEHGVEWRPWGPRLADEEG